MADGDKEPEVNVAEEESSHSELEDDDYDLLEENLGVKVQRRKFKRVRRISDDSDDGAAQGPGDDREAIAQQLFEGSDNEEEKDENVNESRNRDHYSSESDEYSETDDFIVDDDGVPINEGRRQRKRRLPVSNAVVQEAQDIFGVGFDYFEFERFGEPRDEEDRSEEEEDDQEERPRKKRPKKKTIDKIYEALELERAGYSKRDIEIRTTDIPERLQTRRVPLLEANDEELDQEAEWICRNATFAGISIPAYTTLPPPAATESNWGQDWDTRTGVEGGTLAPPVTSMQPPTTDTNWGEDWDTQTSVGVTPAAAPPTAEPNRNMLPPPPATDTNWGEDWDTQTSVGVTPAAAPPVAEPNRDMLPPPAATEANWGQDWDATTSFEPHPAPAASVAESAPVIVPAPAPEVSKNSDLVPKVRKTLELIRNMHFEVPFIAFYRKEFILPELCISDLWKIFRMDAQFCELKKRKESLYNLYLKMKQYLVMKCARMANGEEEMENVRPITDDHLERVEAVQSVEELRDCGTYFTLHYGKHVADMHKLTDSSQGAEEKSDKISVYKLKWKNSSVAYGNAYAMGSIHPFIEKLGITSEKFAENLRDKYQRHEVEQWPVGPFDLAKEIVAGQTLGSKSREVVTSAQYVVSMQIAHEPYVRQAIRKEFFEKATISCWPTKQGQRDIDEAHACFRVKYLKDKPVKSFEGEQFLLLVMAEKDRLMNISIGDTFDNFDEIKHLITRDEFSKPVQEWNDVREVCLKLALKNYLLPSLRKELREKLLDDCYEYILERSRSKLHHWLKVAPIKVAYPEENEIEWDTSQGVRVLSVAYNPEFDHSGVMVAVLRPDGEPDIRSYKNREAPSDRLQLQNFLRRTGQEKDDDMRLLKDYVRSMKPHVIVIAGESREALKIKDNVSQIVAELVTEDAFPDIRVEIVDNEAAKVYAGSKKALADLGSEYSTLLRQAISLGRRVQDPLLELAQLWNADDDILCLKFHPLQDQLPKERLKERLEIEFIDRTCEVGVDINRALSFPHTASVVQFVAGLGWRKAMGLLHTLRQKAGSKLENRSKLLTQSFMGKKVFVNCAGFIKIDTSLFSDSTDTYLEVLDGTRVHPETYEFARQMAVDALYENVEDANMATAVDELLEDPDPAKLSNLDLDWYAGELKTQGRGDKLMTLEDIRGELKEKYRDVRQEYTGPSPDELFNMLTKETPETLYVGKLIMATVGNVIRRKPKEDDPPLEPIQDFINNTWSCSVCRKGGFRQLQEVWTHVDDGSCPGVAVGVLLFLDNGLTGFIPTPKLSDKAVENPEDRVYPGQRIHCRITVIEVERFRVECSSRTSDLEDEREEWRPQKDSYYDKERENHDREERRQEEERLKQRKNRQVYVKRVIVHPSFRNITYKDAEKLMESMDQGEMIVRPSSKGDNHLTVTWKVADGITQHVDVLEVGKSTPFSLGQSLLIGQDEYEDIDEIIARFVSPMASNARDIINYKYYAANLGGSRQKAEEYLKQQKQKNDNKIHYVFQASKDLPGKFMLSYMPKISVVHEFVTVTSDGFRFRGRLFENFNELMRWFKTHYKDPPPTSTPIMIASASSYAADVARRSGYPYGGYQSSRI